MADKRNSTNDINVAEIAFERLSKQDDLSFLEKFAMYIGKVQILEAGLKSVLAKKFGYDYKKIETWTLGRVAKELKENNIRSDFIAFLDGAVEYRNYIAHELLADDILMKNLTGGEGITKPYRILSKASIELEQLMIMYELCQENDAWI